MCPAFVLEYWLLLCLAVYLRTQSIQLSSSLQCCAFVLIALLVNLSRPWQGSYIVHIYNVHLASMLQDRVVNSDGVWLKGFVS